MKKILSFVFISLFFPQLSLGTSVATNTQDSVNDKADTTTYASVEERRLEEKLKEKQQEAPQIIKTQLTRENELKILEKAVDKKLSEIDEKLVLLKAEQQDLDNKKALLEELLTKTSSQEKKRLESLAKIYEKMTAPKAAEALIGIDIKLASDLLRTMKPKSAAAILDQLPGNISSQLTKKVSGTL